MPLNKPSPRLAILRAQLAAEAMDRLCKRITYAGSARNPRVSRAAPPNADLLLLPPSYWDDLEHWLKTLAPAKPVAKQPEPAADVWHSEAPSVAGVYETRPESCDASKARLRWWDGSAWHMNHGSTTVSTDEVRKTDVRPESLYGPLLWLRLIEADKPAQQPAQKASTHSVCIKAYGAWKVGEVVSLLGATPGNPECWLPCDESGWVTHVPTADAVCPVPDGVEFVAKFGNGNVLYYTEPTRAGDLSILWRKTSNSGAHNDIVAWRPIAQS